MEMWVSKREAQGLRVKGYRGLVGIGLRLGF